MTSIVALLILLYILGGISIVDKRKLTIKEMITNKQRIEEMSIMDVVCLVGLFVPFIITSILDVILDIVVLLVSEAVWRWTNFTDNIKNRKSKLKGIINYMETTRVFKSTKNN